MKKFLYLLCVLAMCISPVAAQSFVTGVIKPYAFGSGTVTNGTIVTNFTIDSQGNFTVAVVSNPDTHLMTFTAQPGSPYTPFSVTVTAGPGTTNITQQIASYVPQIGISIGLTSAQCVGTNELGYAIPVECGSGGGATTPATTALLKGNGSANGVVAGVPSTDYAIPAYLNPANAQNNDIARMYNQVLSENHFFFSCDNTDGWYAGGSYTSYGMFAMDIVLAMQAYPSYFTPAQMRNVVLKLDGARNGSGEFPFAVGQACTSGSSIYYSGWDNAHLHAIPEGATGSAFTTNLYFHTTGDTSLYTSVVDDIKAALAIVPRNPTSHLITVNANDQYVPCTGYKESMRSTGDDACANVFYYYAMMALHEVAVAAGDSTNATFFLSEANTTKAAVISELTDSGTQLLKTDTGQLASNLDIFTSAMACYPFDKQTPMLGSTQCTAIANYLDTNSSTLSYDGFFTYSPTAFAVIGTIPPGGSGTGSTLPNQGAGQYQNNGFWQLHAGWVMYLINQVDPAKTHNLLLAFRDGPNPGIEYFDTGTPPILGVAASPSLITSGSGSKLISDINPAPLPIPSGVCNLNLLGVCTGNPVICPPGTTSCGAATSGTIGINPGQTSTTVASTAVTGNSQIFYNYTTNGGCAPGPSNITAMFPPITTTITPGVGFVAQIPQPPQDDFVCLQFFILH